MTSCTLFPVYSFCFLDMRWWWRCFWERERRRNEGRLKESLKAPSLRFRERTHRLYFQNEFLSACSFPASCLGAPLSATKSVGSVYGVKRRKQIYTIPCRFIFDLRSLCTLNVLIKFGAAFIPFQIRLMQPLLSRP